MAGLKIPWFRFLENLVVIVGGSGTQGARTGHTGPANDTVALKAARDADSGTKAVVDEVPATTAWD